jgi:hypothetical protein
MANRVGKTRPFRPDALQFQSNNIHPDKADAFSQLYWSYSEFRFD